MKTYSYRKEEPPIEGEPQHDGVTMLDKLSQDLREQDEIRARAVKNCADIRAAIAQIVDTPQEGTAQTITKYFKVTTTGKLTRKLDVKIWNEIKDEIPEEYHPVRTKLEIDLKKLRAIEQANKEVFQKIARAIDTKEGNTGVKVEVLQ